MAKAKEFTVISVNGKISKFIVSYDEKVKNLLHNVKNATNKTINELIVDAIIQTYEAKNENR